MADYISREAFLEKERTWYCENCDKRKGMKKGKLQVCYEIGSAPCRACAIDDVLTDLEDFPAEDVKEVVLSYDYARLIKALRSDRWNALPPDLRNPVKQAADTIEELYAFRKQITDGNFYCMRDGALHAMTIEPPTGKAIQLPKLQFPAQKEET
ncbi:MAG: hypothetical protein J6S14_02345 [Clostridia bacterium]|nr:hypothetical protein [Clostridia bacterium]